MFQHISRTENKCRKQNKFISNRKERPFPGISEGGRELGSIVHRKQRGLAGGCVWEPAHLRRVSGQALAGQGLTQAPLFTTHKPESWHHDLKTFIWTRWMGKGGSRGLCSALAVRQHSVWPRVPGLLLSVCEAMGKSGDLEYSRSIKKRSKVSAPITSVAKAPAPKRQNPLETLKLSTPEGGLLLCPHDGLSADQSAMFALHKSALI